MGLHAAIASSIDTPRQNPHPCRTRTAVPGHRQNILGQALLIQTTGALDEWQTTKVAAAAQVGTAHPPQLPRLRTVAETAQTIPLDPIPNLAKVAAHRQKRIDIIAHRETITTGITPLQDLLEAITTAVTATTGERTMRYVGRYE